MYMNTHVLVHTARSSTVLCYTEVQNSTRLIDIHVLSHSTQSYTCTCTYTYTYTCTCTCTYICIHVHVCVHIHTACARSSCTVHYVVLKYRIVLC